MLQVEQDLDQTVLILNICLLVIYLRDHDFNNENLFLTSFMLVNISFGIDFSNAL